MTQRAAQLMQSTTPLRFRERPCLFGGRVHLVAIDDASCSGIQLSSFVRNALDTWGRENVRALHIVVPAMTGAAIKPVLVAAAPRNLLGWKHLNRLHFTRPMMRIHSVEDLKRSGALSSEAYILVNRWRDQTLTFMPHKVSDFISCVSHVLEDGKVFLGGYVNGAPARPSSRL